MGPIDWGVSVERAVDDVKQGCSLVNILEEFAGCSVKNRLYGNVGRRLIARPWEYFRKMMIT